MTLSKHTLKILVVLALIAAALVLFGRELIRWFDKWLEDRLRPRHDQYGRSDIGWRPAGRHPTD